MTRARVDLRERLAAAGRMNLFMTFAVIGLSFLAQASLSRRFGAAGLGEYNATALFVTVIATIGFFGVPIATSQGVARLDEAEGDSARLSIAAGLTFALILSGLAAIVSMLLWPLFVSLTSLSDAAPTQIVMAAAVGAVLHSFVVSVLLGRMQMATVTMLVLAQPTAVIFGVATDYGGLLRGGSELAAVGFVVAAAAAAVRFAGERVTPSLRAADARSLLRRSLAATSFLYISLLTGWLDRLVVATIVGPTGLGTFATASYFAEGVLRVPRNAGTFGVAAYARLAVHQTGVQRVLASHIRLLSAVFIVAGSILVAAAGGLLTIAFGADFADAATALQLLAMALLPTGITLALATSAVGAGAPRHPTLLLVLLVAMQLVLGVVGTAALSIAGMALAQIVTWSVALVIYARAANRLAGGALVETLARIAGVAAPVFVVAFMLGRQSLPWPVQAVTAFALSVAIAYPVLLRDADRRLLRRMLAVRSGMEDPTVSDL